MAGPSAGGQSLKLDQITHRFGTTVAVDNVSLDIAPGELVAFLGPSGCGKTTLLRAIGGFLQQSEGSVLIAGEAVDHLPPNKRAVGIVFQSYALFPHMTAAQNIAYGLEARRVARAEIRSRVQEMLALVKLGHLADRFPRALSGGQQQRIALARALAVRPSILLLDEPFAALDKNLRLDMQIEIKRIQRLAGTTTLIVTHDQEEALSMADRVAVFNAGKLEQFAPPTEIYDRPQSLFVNTFVGTANLLSGKVVSAEGSAVHVALDLGGTLDGRQGYEWLRAGDAVTVCVRPEQLGIADDGQGIPGLIEMGLPLGAMVVHEIRIADGRTLKITEPRRPGMQPRPAGVSVHLRPVSAEAVTVFKTPQPALAA